MTSPPQRTNKRQPVPHAGATRRAALCPPRHRREDGPQRIAKLLARAGVASRREIERMIAEGRIALNGEKLTTPATLLEDLVGRDGRRQAGPARRGDAAVPLLQAAGDAHRRARSRRAAPTIYDRLPPGLPRVMPVGRLDFMTEGLLLLTNDGELKRKLELPQHRRRPHLSRPRLSARSPRRSSKSSPTESPSRASTTARSTPISSGAPAAIAGSR